MNDNRQGFPGAGLDAVRGVAIVGDARGLIVQNNAGTPASKVDVTADDVVLMDELGQQYRAAAVSVTGDITALGANGLDVGAEAVSTWYYVWVVYSPSSGSVAALLSTSATTPVLPGGYSYKGLVGAVRNAAGGDFVTFYQLGRRVHLNTTQLFTNKAAGAGNTYEALAGADLTTFQGLVPPIGKTAFGSMGVSVAGNDGGIAIAGDASGLGAMHGVWSVDATVPDAAVLDSFVWGSGFEVPLKSSQNFVWKGSDTQAQNRIMISGYTI